MKSGREANMALYSMFKSKVELQHDSLIFICLFMKCSRSQVVLSWSSTSSSQSRS